MGTFHQIIFSAMKPVITDVVLPTLATIRMQYLNRYEEELWLCQVGGITKYRLVFLLIVVKFSRRLFSTW